MVNHYVKTIACDAVQWDGANFREVADFVKLTNPISWKTEEMYWEDDGVPSDLELFVEYENGARIIPKGYYVARVYGKNDVEIFSDVEMHGWSIFGA